MFSKDLSGNLRLSNWIDLDDARFVEGLTTTALFHAARFANDHTVDAFTALVAARIVAELWGKTPQAMQEWVADFLPGPPGSHDGRWQVPYHLLGTFEH